ncbi:MAG: hypothetical protein MUE52_05240 [Tabrizicola sp.]|jgi:hypothetical protein|nr:hypothetical protein [Tabrizicola sp.]
MFGRKRAIRVLSVVSIALATGHAVETLRTPAVAAANGSDVNTVAKSGPAAPDATLPPSASLDAGSMSDMSALVGITSVAATTDDRPKEDCAASLTLSADSSGMIDVAVLAPCDPGERVVIRHAGLSFTDRTGANGRLDLQIPALESEAMVAAYFEGSKVALANISVPGLQGKARFAVQMAHPVRFDLRAEENGQVFAANSATAGQGPIVTLGSLAVPDPIQTQVYTFLGENLTDSLVTVEVRIDPSTCGGSFPATTVTSVDGVVIRDSISVALPLCGASGDILVLKNLVRDPKLATSN